MAEINTDFKTDVTKGLSQTEADTNLTKFGFNEVATKKANPLRKFLLKFWGITAWMLEAIIILSWFLHRYSDAYIVAGLLLFNAVIAFVQEYNAETAVDTLKKKLQINVRVLRDGAWKTLPSRELVPGDIVRIRIGDFVPADIRILTGEINVDQSAITGESLEVQKKEAEIILSGSIVTKGEMTGIVTLTGASTNFGKTIELVKAAKPASHIQAIISIVVKWLLIIVGVLLAIALIFALFKGIRLLEFLPLMLVLLLGAIPVALTAMFTVCMALGSKQLISQGVLVSRLDSPDDAASMNILCVDKTGTLTMNKLSIAILKAAKNYTDDDLLLFGSLASQAANHDAIDLAFINAAKTKKIATDSFTQKTFIPFDAGTRKTEAVITKTNEEFRVAKGSFDAITEACGFDKTETDAWQAVVDEFGKDGFRTLAVSKSAGDGKSVFIGLVALHDPPRPDSKQLITELKALGVSVKMLTGDALPIARQIAKSVNIGDEIIKASELTKTGLDNYSLLQKIDGVAEVFPKDKYDIIKSLQANGQIVGMTGDGVNDAPALKQAEVGIAVNNATDVAKGAASIILTNDGLAGVVAPIKIGRMMFERINIWILNKIARTIAKTCFIVFAFLLLGKFIITPSAMLIMIFMTDFVKISLSTDNVKFGEKPAKWDITILTKIGIVIGLFMAAEALAILYLGLHFFNLSTDLKALNSYCFEILLFLALFSIFLVREKNHFWHSAPSKTLLYLVIADLILGLSFTSFGLVGFKEIPIFQTLVVLTCAAVFSFLINDFIKIQLFRKWLPKTVVNLQNLQPVL